jgi:hypothetical protein
MAGCIDLVAGRGLSKLNEDEESIVKNNRNDLESFEHYEINKGSAFTGKEEEKSEEGRYADGDYYAKVSISMRSMPNAMNHSLIEEKLGNDPDIKASIDNYNTQVCSSVISNAQSIKNFAGSSIEHQSIAGGSMFISDGVIIASAGGAYIHLKPDGNISIVPGPNGTIKLGDENADKAVLGLQGSEAAPGVVTAPPLVTTAGGAAGVPVSTSTGEFGTKILIK